MPMHKNTGVDSAAATPRFFKSRVQTEIPSCDDFVDESEFHVTTRSICSSYNSGGGCIRPSASSASSIAEENLSFVTDQPYAWKKRSQTLRDELLKLRQKVDTKNEWLNDKSGPTLSRQDGSIGGRGSDAWRFQDNEALDQTAEQMDLVNRQLISSQEELLRLQALKHAGAVAILRFQRNYEGELQKAVQSQHVLTDMCRATTALSFATEELLHENVDTGRLVEAYGGSSGGDAITADGKGEDIHQEVFDCVETEAQPARCVSTKMSKLHVLTQDGNYRSVSREQLMKWYSHQEPEPEPNPEPMTARPSTVPWDNQVVIEQESLVVIEQDREPELEPEEVINPEEEPEAMPEPTPIRSMPRKSMAIMGNLKLNSATEGWLYKKRTGKTGTLKRRDWVKRWFVLRESKDGISPSTLVYYNKQDDVRFRERYFRDSIVLDGSQIDVVQHAPRKMGSLRFFFTVTHPKCGQRFLGCTSEQHRLDWIMALEAAIYFGREMEKKLSAEETIERESMIDAAVENAALQDYSISDGATTTDDEDEF